MSAWRPAYSALLLFAFLLVTQALFLLHVEKARSRQNHSFAELRSLVTLLGLSDLAISTEARYTRHPALSDLAVVFMDHPGAIDHFPSTLFFAAPR